MERKKLNNAKIRSAGYDERNQVLELEFSDGKVLQYTGVSHTVARGLMSAPNAWAYYEDRIAEDYSSRCA